MKFHDRFLSPSCCYCLPVVAESALAVWTGGWSDSRRGVCGSCPRGRDAEMGGGGLLQPERPGAILRVASRGSQLGSGWHCTERAAGGLLRPCKPPVPTLWMAASRPLVLRSPRSVRSAPSGPVGAGVMTSTCNYRPPQRTCWSGRSCSSCGLGSGGRAQSLPRGLLGAKPL